MFIRQTVTRSEFTKVSEEILELIGKAAIALQAVSNNLSDLRNKVEELEDRVKDLEFKSVSDKTTGIY